LQRFAGRQPDPGARVVVVAAQYHFASTFCTRPASSDSARKRS
jgi:hypothetical protein